MATTIGIIGLGQIGTSIGLALKSHGEVDRVLAHTRNADSARKAQAMGALDAAVGMRDLARDCPIIFLCIPLSGMRTALEELRPWLKANTVLIDTAPMRDQANQWANELLPTDVHHIGLVPAPSPSVLGSTEWGVKAASAELFKRSIIMVVPSPRSSAETEDLALNLVRLLGGRPLLSDPTEADGIMTTAHLLPQLTASALIEASIGTAGWQEARKLAGRPFASVTGGMAYFDDPDSLGLAAISNSARVVHGLDVLIAALKGMRDEIDEQDAAQLADRLLHSYRAREHWLDERNEAEWLSEGQEKMELPGRGENLTRMLLGGRMADRSRASSQKPPTRDQKT